MLDQSFSYENFRILLDVENRKGRYLEDSTFFENDPFDKSRDCSKLIIDKNQEIKDESLKVFSSNNSRNRNFTKLDKLKEEKEELKVQREEILEKILVEIAEKTDEDSYELKIKKGQVKWGKQLYEIEHNPENYFVTKQLQRNIYKTFNVKQASRKTVINQLRLLLDDGFPKIIIRTDIKNFYESIPHKELLAIIEENTLLSYPSKKIIRSVLNQYWNILISDGIKTVADERSGIPRGIGFSAYLSELYLRHFDNKIRSLKYATFYTRYVDDIIIIITPKNRELVKSKQSYVNNIKKILFNSTRLKLNVNKTEFLNLTRKNAERKKTQHYIFTYLGYKFKLSYSKKGKNDKDKTSITKDKLQIFMSDDKLQRYKNKIDTSFNDYQTNLIKYVNSKNSTERMLFKRLRFLTKNHRLFRRKSNVFIGVYFSNEFLTEPYSDLIELDEYLKKRITDLPTTTNVKLRAKLNLLSFVEGFRTKSIIRFDINSFKNGKMNKIWKGL